MTNSVELAEARLRAFVAVLEHGLKMGEALALAPEDVSDGLIRVSGRWARTVAVEQGWPEIQEWIDLRRELPGERLFCKSRQPGLGAPWRNADSRKALSAVGLNAYDLRRAYAGRHGPVALGLSILPKYYPYDPTTQRTEGATPMNSASATDISPTIDQVGETIKARLTEVENELREHELAYTRATGKLRQELVMLQRMMRVYSDKGPAKQRSDAERRADALTIINYVRANGTRRSPVTSQQVADALAMPKLNVGVSMGWAVKNGQLQGSKEQGYWAEPSE